MNHSNPTLNQPCPETRQAANFLGGGKLPLRRWMSVFPAFSASAMFAQTAGDTQPSLVPPYGEIPPTFWQQHHTAVIVGGVVWLALIGLILKLLLRPAQRIIQPPDAVARQALASLRNQPEDGRVLSAVSRVLRRYIAEAFALSDGELTTAEFCAMTTKNERLGADLSGALASFLHECDVKKFSAAGAAVPLNAVERAGRLVDLAETRRAAWPPSTAPEHATSE